MTDWGVERVRLASAIWFEAKGLAGASDAEDLLRSMEEAYRFADRFLAAGGVKLCEGCRGHRLRDDGKWTYECPDCKGAGVRYEGVR